MSEETKPKKRGRTKVIKKEHPAKKLIDALQFLQPVQKKTGTVQQRFCKISNGWAIASNDIMTIGVKIDEELEVCPQTTQFKEALKKTDDNLQIVQLSETSISVSSGAFKAVVPCEPLDSVLTTEPDLQIAEANSSLQDAFKLLAPVATEGSPNAVFASVMVQANSAVVTNDHVVLEYWHGIDFPPNKLVPKAAAVAIGKSKSKLVGFGLGEASITFWFENGSFIKTQLFDENYVNYSNLLNVENLNVWEVPIEFFKAVKSIKSFAKNGIVYFEDQKLTSNEIEHEASTYQIEGLPEGMGFNSEYLLMVEKAFKEVHFDKEKNQAHFFGNNVRGLVKGVSKVV